MTMTYLHTCDGCGDKLEVEHGVFGAHALPEGWIRAQNWPSGDQMAEACSWACVSKAAQTKAEESA